MRTIKRYVPSSYFVLNKVFLIVIHVVSKNNPTYTQIIETALDMRTHNQALCEPSKDMSNVAILYLMNYFWQIYMCS